MANSDSDSWHTPPRVVADSDWLVPPQVEFSPTFPEFLLALKDSKEDSKEDSEPDTDPELTPLPESDSEMPPMCLGIRSVKRKKAWKRPVPKKEKYDVIIILDDCPKKD